MSHQIARDLLVCLSALLPLHLAVNLGRKGPESPLHALCQSGIYQSFLMHLLNELTK